jgi:hypothetical protein
VKKDDDDDALMSLPRISNYFGHAKALLHEAVSYLRLKTWVVILFEDT